MAIQRPALDRIRKLNRELGTGAMAERPELIGELREAYQALDADRQQLKNKIKKTVAAEA